MADGSQKLVVNAAPGDRIKTPCGEDEIECIVRTFFDDGVTLLCELDGGWLGTPHHPVLVDGAWVHPKTLANPQPRQCDYTYSFLLRGRTSSMIVNGWVCGTLAHGTEGDVIGHAYFGTERVVEDL